MKNKNVAGALSIFLGFWGAHRFYLGQRFLGIIYFALGIFTIILTAEEGVPFVLLPAVLAMVDAALFFAMPREDFDRKYNKHAYRGAAAYYPEQRRPYHPGTRKQPDYHELKRWGIRHFRHRRFEEAAEYFERALELDPENAAMHYNLAATYSMLRDEDRAFFNLEEAVALGFDQYQKIHEHDALAYLRSLPVFNAFVENGYPRPSPSLPAPDPNTALQPQQQPASATTPETKDPASAEYPDLLTQIAELGKLRDRGILTEEEFRQQKQKILQSR